MRTINTDFYIDNEPKGKNGDICIDPHTRNIAVITDVEKIEVAEEKMQEQISKVQSIPDFNMQNFNKGNSNIYRYEAEYIDGKRKHFEFEFNGLIGLDSVRLHVAYLRKANEDLSQQINQIKAIISE